MNTQQLEQCITNLWDKSIVEQLIEYIKIPCKSPLFDPDWQQHGYIQQAIELLASWAKEHATRDMHLEIVQLEGRTPLIYIDIPGDNDDTILMYGHMDKQPEMTGWAEDLGPWKPVIKDNKLYGRGGADDGYALYASLAAVLALQEQNILHARCVLLIEACEESGSYDLPFYIDHLKEKIGTPSLVICLDSGAGNYEQLWNTTSLRGNSTGVLQVDILKEGVHSGAASGAVADSFRIARQLLSRIEDEKTGEVTLKECHVEIPKARLEQTEAAAKVLKNELWASFPFYGEAQLRGCDATDTLLQKTWYPTITVTGIDGVPNIANAGNVLRPFTKLKLSFRLPPTCDSKTAMHTVKMTLEQNPPYNANVTFNINETNNGWNAPAMADWLVEAENKASEAFFGKPALNIGEGGSIPFMGMLGEKFPKAQFLITGVLGPLSNAHGPNEFLHIPFAKKITCCVAYVIAEHYKKAQ